MHLKGQLGPEVYERKPYNKTKIIKFALDLST